MYRKTVLVASCLALLAVATPARAGEPFTIANAGSNGGLVHGAVNPTTGILTVAWINSTAANQTVQVCQVKPGATACSATPETLKTENGDYDNPYVLINGPNTYVIMQRYVAGDILVWTSMNGAAFPEKPTTRAVKNNNLGSSEPVLNPTTNIATIGLASTSAQSFPLTGPTNVTNTPDSTANLAGAFESEAPRVGLIDGKQPMLAGTSGGKVKFHRYKASASTSSANELNKATNWDTDKTVADGSEARLAGGVNGLFLFMNKKEFGVPSPDRYQVRKFDGTTSTFGPPVSVGASFGEGNNPDFTQTQRGELLAAFAGQQSGTLRLSRSTDAGASFSEPVDIVRGDVSSSFRDLDVVAANDGRGFAVWVGPGGGIRAASLEALPPELTPGTTDPDPDTTDPDPDTPFTLTPPPAATKPKSTSVSLLGARLTFQTPGGSCIPAGKIRATLKVAKRRVKRSQRTSRRLFVKVTKVEFYVDSKRKKTDKKAPFRQTLTITGLVPGSKHTLSARVFIKVRGKGLKKSIRRSFTVCG